MNKMKKIIVLISLVLMLLPNSVSFAGPMQDLQNDVGTDKVAHFGVGYIINDQLERHTKFTPLERLLTVTAIAYVKESTDDHFDRNDLLATMAGGLMYEVKF